MAGSGRPSIRQAHAIHEIRRSCSEVHRHRRHRNWKCPAVSQQQRSGLPQSRRASGGFPAGAVAATARLLCQPVTPSARDAAKDGFHFPDVLRRLQVEVRPAELAPVPGRSVRSRLFFLYRHATDRKPGRLSSTPGILSGYVQNVIIGGENRLYVALKVVFSATTIGSCA